MRASFTTAIFLGVLTCFGSAPLRGQASLPTDHASWWIRTYGVVNPKQNEPVRHAYAVFDRLSAAADKRSNRMPRLVIIRAEGSPFAMALSDGTILLTEGGLEICHQGASEEMKTAQLAFVLGHELAHLSNDDFWHAAAFSAFDSHGAHSRTRDALRPLLERKPDDARRAELQADAFGMLYMTTAGYDPQAVLSERNFFTKWAHQMESVGIGLAESHPEPQERADFLKAQMVAITEDLDLYDFGIRLFQLGRFEDAIVLLERFGDRFPSLEVLNNIGLSHLQLAAWFLSRCDERLVVAFKLPTMLDPATRARRLRAFESAPSPCFRNERFDHHYQEAERYLRQAVDKSPDYLPSRLNLLSLLILGQKGADALAAAQDALRVRPNDTRVLAARAAAMFLIERETNVGMADAAVEELQRIWRNHPESSDAAYNLGAILSERRRVESAKTAWQGFLALEPDGLYADVVRDYLGISRTPPPKTGPWIVPRPPVDLGTLNLNGVSARFPEVQTREIEIGAFNGRVLRAGSWRAFAIESVIEVVEEKIQQPFEGKEARARYGNPSRSQSTSSGEVLFYPTFAVELVNDVTTALLFFGETRTQ